MWIIVIVIVLLAGAAAWGFNGLVRRRNRTTEAWSQIDVELKRRHDLIPNLVQTVKGYASHESSTFEAVTAARTAAQTAARTGDPGQIASAENTLTSSVRSLLAVAENYPTLRAADNFRDLQEQLTATEDKLEYARRYYNSSCQAYNTAIQSFPRSLVAAPLGFHAVTYFHADPADAVVPQVDFSLPAPRATS